MIAGSAFPPIVYGFACYTADQTIYLTSISVSCLCALIMTFLPKADQPKYRKFRGFVFLLVGLLAGLPMFHAWTLGTPHMDKLFWIAGGICYLIGASLYVSRFPERFFPGSFDYFV